MSEKMPWEEQEIAEAQENSIATLSTDLCFMKDFTPDNLVETMLNKFSAMQAFAVLKKYGEVIVGTSTKTGAIDLLKERAINCTNSKMMPIEIGGRIVAYANEKNLPGRWEYANPTLAKMEEDFAAQKKKIDELKKLLQTLKSEMVDTATGEVMIPAVKVPSGSTVAIEFL